MPDRYCPKSARHTSQPAPQTAFRQPETLTIHPRSDWTSAAPVVSKLDPMGQPTRITVHHEGDASWRAGPQVVASHLAKVRTCHMKPQSDGGLGAGDIGYHYIIDCSGEVWEGRPMAYQGAHAGNFWLNKGNIGVCVLGNYDRQPVNANAKTSLRRLLQTLMRRYNVGADSIYTHRELKSTECPGRNLQACVDEMRLDFRLGK